MLNGSVNKKLTKTMEDQRSGDELDISGGKNQNGVTSSK